MVHCCLPGREKAKIDEECYNLAEEERKLMELLDKKQSEQLAVSSELQSVLQETRPVTAATSMSQSLGRSSVRSRAFDSTNGSVRSGGSGGLRSKRDAGQRRGLQNAGKAVMTT